MNTMNTLAPSLRAASAVTSQGDAAAPAACAREAVDRVRKRHSDWILEWDKQPGDPPFDMRRKFGSYYSWESDQVVLYDTFEPQHRVARSAEEYGSFWAEPFTALRSARHRVLDGPDVIVSGDLAASTMEFAARLESGDRRVVGIRARSSIVWTCEGGCWRIVREHNSTRVVDREEIDRWVEGG